MVSTVLQLSFSLNPFSRIKEVYPESSTNEKVKKVIKSPLNENVNFFKTLKSKISSTNFFSKKTLLNLTLFLPIVAFSFFIVTTFGISELVFQVLLGVVSIKAINHVVKKLREKNAFPTLNDLFPKNQKIQILIKVLIGIAFGLITLKIEPLLTDKISAFLKKIFNVTLTERQNVEALLTEEGLFGILMCFYAAIGAPIIEEFGFRGLLHNYFDATSKSSDQLKTKLNNNDVSRLEKIKKIVKTSLIFGTMHLSPVMGWTNVPIMIVITLMGAGMSILKETTGDLWAPTAMHATNNTIAVLHLRKII